ncbi:MAG: quinolinate synthase NadA [Christensenellales bacterium]
MNLTDRIREVKKEKNAVILAHYYTPGETQAIADHVGDSYGLAKQARQTRAETIVFCGVYFMGESAKILNPDKTILMPDLSADCPMAHMANERSIAELRAKYKDLAVVCYINSSAELKGLSDVCVTSSNAAQIVRQLPNQNIFFIPDRNLGRYVARAVPEKHVLLNDGYCPVHAEISRQKILDAKNKRPEALLLSHPECGEEILEISDFIGSTAKIIEYAKNSAGREFIIATEEGVRQRLERDNPEKSFLFPNPPPVCGGMKLNTLERILHVLETGENRVEIDETPRRKALIPLERMLALSK